MHEGTFRKKPGFIGNATLDATQWKFQLDLPMCLR